MLKTNRTGFILILAVLMSLAIGVTIAHAEPVKTTIGDYDVTVFDNREDLSDSSFRITKYNGSATDVIIPVEWEYDGQTRTYTTTEDRWFTQIDTGAFTGNTTIRKVAIPNGVTWIRSGAFENCTGLVEVAIGNRVNMINEDAFAGCTNVKTYRVSKNSVGLDMLRESGMCVDSTGKPYAGITVYTVQGSNMDKYVQELNAKGGQQITLKYESDPYSGNTVGKPDEGGSGGSGGSGGGGSGSNPETQMGEGNSPVGKGASAQAAEKAILAATSDEGPAGSVFNLLQAKSTKQTKTSVKLTWKKAAGAKTFVVYGSACGKANKFVKIGSFTGASATVKKISGKALKKGTYYKFIVVALDSNNKVVTTAKTVHAATSGGKAGNPTKVTTKAKKNKVTVKVKKTFKLVAKQAGKNIKKHRAVSYESSNTAIATVTKKGVVKGVKKGSCFVYAYCQNGVAAKIKVTVK